MYKVAFKGNPITLVGRFLKVGQAAPDFKVAANDLKEVSLADFSGKIKVLSVFPSIDTPVCDLQVKEFNKRATGFSADVVVLGISKDLPFAQKRFCEANDIKNVITLSDYKASSFGINYGLLIKELGLLARSVIILDKLNTARYIQVVKELSTPPDYEDVLKNLAEVIKTPELQVKQDLPSKCKPCEAGTPPMPKEKIDKLLAQYRGWQLVEDKKIVKEFKFKDFVEAKYFLDLVSVIAQDQGHHPSFSLVYNKLKITLTTHAAGGLTDNDFIIAKAIDEVGRALRLFFVGTGKGVYESKEGYPAQQELSIKKEAMIYEIEATIKEIIQRTPSVKSVRVNVSGPLNFKAGQFLCVSFKGENKCTANRYLSISNSPTEEGYIEFTKRITQSDFSKSFDALQSGEVLKLQYPFGKFTLQDNPAEKVAFLSGGIGITPIRSICKFVSDKKLGTDIVLIYANRSISEIVFKDDFELMRKQYPKLKVAHVLCEPAPGFKCTVGLISAQIIKNEVVDFASRKFFICGPPAMVEAMKKILTEELGLPKESIVTENFQGY